MIFGVSNERFGEAGGAVSSCILLFAKLAQLAVAILISLVLLYVALPKNPNSYLQGFMMKNRIYENASSPKIVLLGFSNLGFGVDSEKLANAFGSNVVNMGFHGGVGISLLLNSIEPSRLSAGDIVIVALEYGAFREGVYQGGITVAELLFEDPRVVRYLGPEHLPLVCESFGRLCWLRLSKAIRHAPFNAEGVYNAKAFNIHGDVVSHLELEEDTASVPVPVISAPERFRVDVKSAAMQKLQQFVSRVKGRGARVYIVPPCYREQEYDANKDAIAKHYNTLRAQFPGITLSDPGKFVFSSDLCFDTEYHLNKKGREIRTARLIDTIRAVCPSG
jgi:hypothetical protein